MLCLELADEARVPELACYAEVLAAPHERIALACLGRGGDAVRVEVFLFTARDGDEAVVAGDLVFGDITQNRRKGDGAHRMEGVTHRPWQTRAYSRLTILGPTLVSLRGARPHAPGPKALLRTRRYLISGR